MKQKLKGKNFQTGFTIVEIVVATTLFAVTITALLALFNYVLKINRRTEALRQASQGMRNFVEFFAKEIRNGQIDYGIVNNGGGISPTWPIGPCGTDPLLTTVGQDSYNAKENKLALFTDDGLEECIFYADDNNNFVGHGVFAAPSGKKYSLAIQKTGVSSVQILNPPNFSVDSMAFYIRPARDPYTSPFVKIQPMVTISIKFNVQLPTGETQPIYYQTTISSNRYDIPNQ